MSRPLLVTADPDTLDDLLRLAATAGVEVDVAQDAGAARASWAAASLVVLGTDAVDGCSRSRLPRRADVVVLGLDLDDASIWRRALDAGAEKVLFLPDAEAWLIEAFSEAVERAGGRGLLVATLGGRGGAGATTLSVALSLSGARSGLSTLLVDGDPLGGGVDLVFGGESVGGVRWPDLAATRGRLAGGALHDALPQLDGIAVLSWDRGDAAQLPLEAVQAVLDAGRRSCDLVVVDLPRTLDEVAREVLALATCALLVVPAEVRATAAAARVATRAGLLCRDLRLVVRGPAPDGLAARDVQRALGLPLVGELRAEPGIDEDLERGEAPGRRARSPLAGLCDDLIGSLLEADEGRRAA